jgi:hypothetical protein
MVDFPGGMAQEFVWPLALAFTIEAPGNIYYRQQSIKDWVEAGILFAARSAHGDGSCDDYFPFERAAGAGAFSLLACVESYALLELKNDSALRFFERRADWLARHHESGRLSNHQALIALSLELLARMLGKSKWDEAKRRRAERVLDWQSEEGWFQEYEGCDPGYHTLTVSCLARLYQLSPTSRLKDALARAVRLAGDFTHPDGSFGGEYGSRNTYNFFPHGFELVGMWMPEALSINDRFLAGLESGLAPCYSDDHILGHHAWNYFLAYRDFVDQRADFTNRASGRTWLKQAGLIVERRGGTELYLALNKGGVFKLFRDDKLVTSDTQISIQSRDGNSVRNAVGHLIDDYKIIVAEDEISISGTLGWAKHKQMTTVNLMVLRFVMLTVGRFFPNLIRKLLQRMLIMGKEQAPFSFSRVIKWKDESLSITDELHSDDWDTVVAAGIGCDQTSIYVVMSRTFQRGQLQPWLDLTDEVRKLDRGQALKLERFF